MFDASSAPRALVATCSRGLEEVLTAELGALGVAKVEPGRGFVSFSGGLREVYEANLRLRTAMRIVIPVATAQIRGRDDLYRLAASTDWSALVARGQTIVVDVAGANRTIRNTAFAAQLVKDAVVDTVRKRLAWRPSVDRREPDLRIHLHLSDGVSSLGLDSTGEPLSHRGYRPRGGPAPLAETLAAGVLLLAGYDGSVPLLDPMCGTGTFLVEAALIATHTAPGLHRSFAFERWAWSDPALLAEARRAAESERREATAPIVGSDCERRAVRAADHNLEAAGMLPWVNVEQRDALDLELPWAEGGLIVTNPPYGRRMGDLERLGDFYERFGDRLKSHAQGATAWLLAGNRELASRIGLRPSRRIPVFNGPIECRLLCFELYAGSRKQAPGS